MDAQKPDHPHDDSVVNAKPTVIDHSYSSNLHKSEVNPAKNRTHKRRLSSGDSSSFLTFILMLAAAILVAFLITSFVFQQYEVDGPSMQTTLHNQDRLVVVKLQRTWSDITGHPYIPSRGDIIIFSENGLYNSSGIAEKQLVKRVVALPGERVVIKNGDLTVYNKANPNGFDPDKTMPYGKVIGYTAGNLNEVIPANTVFVCGDNRPDSLDSRYFGPVQVKDIIGKVDLRIYPFNSLSVF